MLLKPADVPGRAEHLPESGHEVAGGPAHNEAPLCVRASLAHFLQAVGRPHLTHPDLGLHLEVGGRSAADRAIC